MQSAQPNSNQSSDKHSTSTPSAGGIEKLHRCRFCHSDLRQLVVDLGMQPLCESYVSDAQLYEMEPFYPLKAYVCEDCFLVQVLDFVGGEEIYSHYAYFSSYSESWLRHSKS